MEKEFAEKDESITIPANHFVCGADFDCEEPYIKITNKNNFRDEKKIRFPKALAYYLRTHYCGSEEMRNLLTNTGMVMVQEKIKNALDL